MVDALLDSENRRIGREPPTRLAPNASSGPFGEVASAVGGLGRLRALRCRSCKRRRRCPRLRQPGVERHLAAVRARQASSATTRRTTPATTTPSPTTRTRPRTAARSRPRPTSTTSASTCSASRPRAPARSAVYLAGPNAGKPQVSGFNAAGAWKLERGRPDVDGRDPRHRHQVGQRGPAHPDPPQQGRAAVPNHARRRRRRLGARRGLLQHGDAYDANGDGAFNVDRLRLRQPRSASSGRRRTATPAARRRGPDRTRSRDGTDDDDNGYVDDIAGWDFFDNDNDPYDASSYFAAAQPRHRPRRRARPSAATTAHGGIGVCPHCQILPLRTWDTFVSDGNTFAMGIALRDRQRRRGDRGRQRQRSTTRPSPRRPRSTPTTTASCRPTPATTSTRATTTTRPTTATRC